MSVPPGKVPIFESVREAMSFARTHWAALAPGAAIAAAAAGFLGVAAGGAAAGGDLLGWGLFQILTGVVTAVYFAGALARALGKPPGRFAGLALGPDGWNLFAAMAVIGFFLFIVFGVGLLPGAAVLGSMFAPVQDRMAEAQADPAVAMALMEEVFRANAATVVLLVMIYGAVWMALTSRLYLAAPASVAENRAATFETWRWTAGNMLRISAARLLLLVPALFFAGLLQSLAGMLLGVDPGDAGAVMAAAGTPAYLALSIWAAFVGLWLYGTLEAGLSAYLYRGMRPQ